MGQQSPGGTGHLVGQRHGDDAAWAPGLQGCQPGTAGPLSYRSVAQRRRGAQHQQAPQLAVALLGDRPQPFLAAARVLPWHQADPRRQVPARAEHPGVRHAGRQGRWR